MDEMVRRETESSTSRWHKADRDDICRDGSKLIFGKNTGGKSRRHMLSRVRYETGTSPHLKIGRSCESRP